MLPGYNHNVDYLGRTFHVQTEDSGIDSPHIITHLFENGNVLETRKFDYTSILDSEQRDQVLMSVMINQHQALMRDLQNGELDACLTAASASAQVEPSNDSITSARVTESVETAEPANTVLEKIEVEPAELPDENTPEDKPCEVPDWLVNLPPPLLIRRTLAPHELTNEDFMQQARVTIDEIVSAGGTISLPQKSASAETLDDAMDLIFPDDGDS